VQVCRALETSLQTNHMHRPRTQERDANSPAPTLVKLCLLSSASLSLLFDRLLMTLRSSWRLPLAPTVLIQAYKQ
jgi:hypothetical protein